jgi:DNA-binding GntR family transcriptional regulator
VKNLTMQPGATRRLSREGNFARDVGVDVKARRDIDDGNGHVNLTQRAYQIIKSRILTGELAPGTPLSTARVAARLHMSPMPVRSAFATLQTEGLVAIVAKRGVLVSQISAKELQHNAIVRSRLEGLAAYLACTNKRRGMVVGLRKCLVTMKMAVGSGASDAWIDANNRLHEIITAASGNPVLARLIRDLRYHALRGRFVTGHIPGHAERQTTEHAKLVAALAAGDRDEAERIMREHILAGGAEVAAYVRTLSRRRQRRASGSSSVLPLTIQPKA